MEKIGKKKRYKKALSYGKLAFLSLTKLKQYTKLIVEFDDLQKGVFFAASNISIGILLQIFYKMVKNRSWVLFFPAVSEALMWVILIFIPIFLLGVVLFLISKILGGSAGLKKSLIVTLYCTVPIMLIFLPYLQILAFVWLNLMLTLGFYYLNSYSFAKAMISVIFPMSAIVVILFILGILNIAQLSNF